MRFHIIVWLLLTSLLLVKCSFDVKNDFTEFDSPEDFDSSLASKLQQQQKSETITNRLKDEVVFEDDEFSSLHKDDENNDIFETKNATKLDNKQEQKIKQLTFADIPSHLRANWSSYQVEAVFLVFIFIYAINYIYGSEKNHALAEKWFANSQPILEQQFALVGDDGISQELTGGQMIKETEANYSIWSTGRVGVQVMISELNLLKRQDLLGIVLSKFTSNTDRVIHQVMLDVGEMDTFVLAFGLRKSLVKNFKEYIDLSSFTTEKKNSSQYGLPLSFTVFAEISESIPALIDRTTCQFFKRHERFIDYFHFSDQFCGKKTPDEILTKLPETKPVLIFSFNVIESEQTAETEQILLQFVFHTVDRIRRYKLSREGKQKADKNRRAIEESFFKNTHQQRQDAAQTRREEKIRERKARLLEVEDPAKAAKLQRLEDKKGQKTKQPKVKQMRVK